MANRRILTSTYGGVRGRELVTPSYSIMVTTLNGTTKVEFVYIPSSSGDIKSAFIYDGYETNEAHFRIDFYQLETTLGHGYFLVYKNDIAVRTKSFTFIKAE